MTHLYPQTCIDKAFRCYASQFARYSSASVPLVSSQAKLVLKLRNTDTVAVTARFCLCIGDAFSSVTFVEYIRAEPELPSPVSHKADDSVGLDINDLSWIDLDAISIDPVEELIIASMMNGDSHC